MAELAIQELDQSSVHNRIIYVNIARQDPHYQEYALPSGDSITNMTLTIGEKGITNCLNLFTPPNNDDMVHDIGS